jgi:predicted RNA binding protein YcfA (HicA-like mRNA interferase family)
VSPGLPRISGDDVVKALGKEGFEPVRIRGSHCKLRKDGRTVIVPLHKELAKGTLASILRQAGLDADRLRDLLA